MNSFTSTFSIILRVITAAQRLHRVSELRDQARGLAQKALVARQQLDWERLGLYQEHAAELDGRRWRRSGLHRASNPTLRIRSRAPCRREGLRRRQGLNVDVVAPVMGPEGLHGYVGDGSSFGDFQRHKGGLAGDGNRFSGLRDLYGRPSPHRPGRLAHAKSWGNPNCDDEQSHTVARMERRAWCCPPRAAAKSGKAVEVARRKFAIPRAGSQLCNRVKPIAKGRQVLPIGGASHTCYCYTPARLS